MTIQGVLLPLFLEVILTFGLLFWLAPLRTIDFSSGVAQPENVALREPNWSKRSLQVGYSYSNQFELPVPFYVLTILAWGDAARRSRLRGAGLDFRDLPLSAGLVIALIRNSALTQTQTILFRGQNSGDAATKSSRCGIKNSISPGVWLTKGPSKSV